MTRSAQEATWECPAIAFSSTDFPILWTGERAESLPPLRSSDSPHACVAIPLRQQLSDHFSGAGKITYAGIKTDDKGQSRGFGVVEFERIDEATRAIDRYNGSNIGSRVIKVRYDTKETTAGGPDPADNQPTKYARQEPPQSYGMVAPMAIPMAIPMGGVGSGGGGNVMVGPSAGAGYGRVVVA